MTDPDQTVRVPLDPTAEMIEAGEDTWRRNIHGTGVVQAYRAMLAAAPSPEAEGVGERMQRRFDAILSMGGYHNVCASFRDRDGHWTLSTFRAELASLQRPQTTAPDSGLVDRLVEAFNELTEDHTDWGALYRASDVDEAIAKALALARKGAA